MNFQSDEFRDVVRQFAGEVWEFRKEAAGTKFVWPREDECVIYACEEWGECVREITHTFDGHVRNDGFTGTLSSAQYEMAQCAFMLASALLRAFDGKAQFSLALYSTQMHPSVALLRAFDGKAQFSLALYSTPMRPSVPNVGYVVAEAWSVFAEEGDGQSWRIWATSALQLSVAYIVDTGGDPIAILRDKVLPKLRGRF